MDPRSVGQDSLRSRDVEMRAGSIYNQGSWPRVLVYIGPGSQVDGIDKHLRRLSF